MKLTVLGIMLVIPLGHAAEQSDADRGESQNTHSASAPFDLSAFTAEVPVIEEAFGKATGYPREDSLAMLGRSSAASGRFDVAAAAYAMFLNEFGTEHPYSERSTMRFADCLFPFRYDQVDVLHAASGPRLEPAWRMGYTARPEHLRQAVHAFELAASLAQDANSRGSALLKLGWVHRVLGDWDASTAAWDRCATVVAQTKLAADALWLAAENLEWTNRPAAATERLTQLTREFPQADRVSAATERVEYLQADARRSSDWLADPVASLKAEIEARSSHRSASQVYRSVVQWLQRRGEREALIALSRWACDQDNWPVKERITCWYDLTDALLQKDDEGSRDEAVRQLQEIVELAPDDATAVHTAIRCCRILQGLERHDEAERMMEAVAGRVKGSRPWEPIALADLAEMLVKRGAIDRAVRVLNKLAASYPDSGVSEHLEVLRNGNRAEGGR
jgi:tetratricopeptide (TPR) repeat protein